MSAWHLWAELLAALRAACCPQGGLASVATPQPPHSCAAAAPPRGNCEATGARVLTHHIDTEPRLRTHAVRTHAAHMLRTCVLHTPGCTNGGRGMRADAAWRVSALRVYASAAGAILCRVPPWLSNTGACGPAPATGFATTAGACGPASEGGRRRVPRSWAVDGVPRLGAIPGGLHAWLVARVLPTSEHGMPGRYTTCTCARQCPCACNCVIVRDTDEAPPSTIHLLATRPLA